MWVIDEKLVDVLNYFHNVIGVWYFGLFYTFLIIVDVGSYLKNRMDSLVIIGGDDYSTLN